MCISIKFDFIMRNKLFMFFCFRFAFAVSGENFCTTPDGAVGLCVHLVDCPKVLSTLANPKRDTVALDKYFCLKRDMVCCEIVNNNDTYALRNAPKHISNRAYCGLQHSDDYFHPVDEVGLHEFPWLALIVLKVLDKGVLHSFPICTGVLINTRFVLTSTDCLSKHVNSTVSVRLGKFSTANAAKADCMENVVYNVTECSDSEEYQIEKLILHPYRVSYTYNNDIALIRLKRAVLYSDSIRPICLPTPDTTFAKIGDTLYVSGWNDQFFVKGKTTKRKIPTALIKNEQCSRILRTTITDYNICTIDYGNNTESQCYLDKGGPLVFSYRNQWHVEGILAEFAGRCDNSGPLIFMRVSQYLDWIYDNIKL